MSHNPVEAEDLARLTGHTGNPAFAGIATEAVEIVTIFVRNYTRDNGFNEAGEPNRDLHAVIRSAAVRLTTNPAYIKREQAGTQSITPSTLDGFTLPELAVLNRYRKRAT